MGIIGAICGAVCAIASAAVSVAKTLGAIGLAVEGIKAVVNAIISVCKSLGLIEEKTEPEELGDKALQAEEEGIKPEKFDTYEEYVKAVEEFEIDPEKSKKYTTEEKLLKASELTSGLLIEKMPGINITSFPDVLLQYSPEKIAAIINTLKDGKGETFNNILGVISNKEKDPDKISDGIGGLVSVEKILNPELSDSQALRQAMNSMQKG